MLALVLLLMSTFALAYETAGMWRYTVNDDNTATITGLTDDSDFSRNNGVDQVNDLSNSTYQKVDISNKLSVHTVTAIADDAFNSSDYTLNTISIDPQVKSIGANAFTGHAISTLTFGFRNNIQINSIGDNAFSGHHLLSVTLPRNMTYIGASVFTPDTNIASSFSFTLPTPSKSGYRFIGWIDGNNNPVTGTTIEGTELLLSYTAQFESLTDATLSNMAISEGRLSPAFASDTVTYTASVSNNVTSILVEPTTNNSNATPTPTSTPRETPAEIPTPQPIAINVKIVGVPTGV